MDDRMSKQESPTKFVVFVNDLPYEFRDSREEAENILRQKQLEGEVREVTDGELLCPGCCRNKLVYQYHAGENGGHMTCRKCGRISIASPP